MSGKTKIIVSCVCFQNGMLHITNIQYIPRNMHMVFALLCFVVVIHWLIFPYPSGLLHWHCGNLTIAPMPAKQPWWIWINTSCEFIMNDCITTTKQSTTKPCAYFMGYTVHSLCIYPNLYLHVDGFVVFCLTVVIYFFLSNLYDSRDALQAPVSNHKTICLWKMLP